MSKKCDNKSVGVIVTDTNGNVALLKRAFFPVGIAPPAGHVDDHGSYQQAALDEVAEEIGLRLESGQLSLRISDRRVNNACKRLNGDHHIWSVYEYKLTADEPTHLRADPTETKGAFWATKAEAQHLANRTRAYQADKISQTNWQAEPGLEEIWLDFLVELGYVE